MSPVLLLFCSLIMTWPAPNGSATVWFGSPLTTIDWPLMVSPTSSELPLADAPPGPHTAVARAGRLPAENRAGVGAERGRAHRESGQQQEEHNHEPSPPHSVYSHITPS